MYIILETRPKVYSLFFPIKFENISLNVNFIENTTHFSDSIIKTKIHNTKHRIEAFIALKNRRGK